MGCQLSMWLLPLSPYHSYDTVGFHSLSTVFSYFIVMKFKVNETPGTTAIYPF